MDNFNFKKYLKEGKLNQPLNEFTDYGGQGIYPKKEKPGDMFQQKEVEELFPIAFSSKDDKDFRDKLEQHADWTEQSGYNNTFVHMQYHETKNLPDDYFIYQTQHYNTNYDDFRNPRFTILSITKNRDTDKEEDLGSYIVSTPEYIKDIRALDVRDKLGRAVSEAMGINDPVLVAMRAAKSKADRTSKMLSQPKSTLTYDKKVKLDFLKKERAQLMRDMEQEAEPEGGPIADEYGSKLNRIDAAIAKLEGRKEMTYDQAVGRDRNLREAYEIGDEVILRGGSTVTDVLKVVDMRRMFGSNLMAYKVEFPDGRVAEYDETQLSLNPGFAQDLETRADDYFSEPLKEFIGGDLEKRNDALYSKLVPGMGKADTQEGEMLRDINRIIYRYYNDGDEYFRGYGTETAGPAHSFLVNANTGVRSAMEKIFGDGTNYEETIEDALEHILSHIEAKQGKYTPNTEDMFSYEAEFEDEEDYEDDYYDEEDEYYEK